MGAVMGANILNLIFNIFLGRTVSASEFGVIILVTNFIYIGGMFVNALSATINREISMKGGSQSTSASFMRHLYVNVLRFTIPLSVIWIIASPFVSTFFHVPNIMVFLLFTPVIFILPYLAGGRGYFQGRFAFLFATILIVMEPLLKLISAGVLIALGLHAYIYTSLYISVIITGILALILIFRIKPSETKIKYHFPKKFFFSAVLAAAAGMAFLSLDVILAKHYLTPAQAGQYSLLSLVGKMLYFMGTLLNVFTISLIGRDLGNKKNPRASFYRLLSGSLFLCIMGFIVLGSFKDFTLPLLFGAKALPILPFLNSYLMAMILFTLASLLTSYHLVKNQIMFPIVSLISAPLLIIGLVLFHSNIQQIINVMVTVSVINFVALIILHLKSDVFGDFNLQKLTNLEQTNI